MMIRAFPAAVIPLALLTGAACVLSAADRSVRTGLSFPALLSHPELGAAAPRRDSLAALQRADFPRAEALAEIAVARDPVQQQSTALLGAARLSRQAPDSAQQAFLVAGALGWRDPITQHYWFDYARTVGDFDVAAQRVDALLRTRNDAAAAPALEVLESSPPGRRSLARRLALDPPWRDQYVLETASLPSPQTIAGRVESLQRARMAGMGADCGIAAAAARRLVDSNRHDAAATLWRTLCVPSSDAASSFLDGGFSRVRPDREASPFEWSLITNGSVEVHVDALPLPLAGKGLFTRSTSSVREPVARKWLALTPGHYMLSWSSSTGGISASSPFSMSFNCPRAQPGAPLESISIGQDRYASTVVVPRSDCPVQLLKIFVERSNGGTEPYLSDLRIASSPEHPPASAPGP